MERWAKGQFWSHNQQVYVVQDATALGGTKLLEDLSNLEYKDIEKFYDDRNQEFIRYNTERQQTSSETGGSN